MGLFNRGPKLPQVTPTGSRCDVENIIHGIGMGTRPGLERYVDGHYWVARVLVDTRQSLSPACLQMESMADAAHVRDLMPVIARNHGKQLQRQNQPSYDDLSGM